MTSLTITSSSSRLRRALGPSAWSLLEVLALDVDGDVVATSARRLAAELGVDKNTAAKSLRRLRSAGLVRAIKQRRVGGRLGSGGYRLDLDALGLHGVFVGSSPHLTASDTTADAAVDGRHQRVDDQPALPTRRRREDVSQLSLLDPSSPS